MRLIDADELKKELRQLYADKGWGDRDIHFSLADMEWNIDFQETVFDESDIVEINQRLNKVRAALLLPLFGGKGEEDES